MKSLILNKATFIPIKTGFIPVGKKAYIVNMTIYEGKKKQALSPTYLSMN